ncbi:hypothetical protein DDE82_003327 [Stemphylium lycopersici]|nr:hypothetical protein DDE82_003327 [Stemphylium lycopersici]
MSIRTDSIGFLDPRSVIAGYHQYRFKDSMAHAKRPSITSDWDKIPKHKWIFKVVMIYLAFEPLVGRSILKGFPLRRFAEHSSMTQAILLNGASLRHFIYPICIDLFRRGKHAPDGLGAVTQLLQEHGHWNIPNPSHGSADKITVSSQAKGNLSQSDFPVNGLQSSLIETMPELSSDIGGSTSTATSTALLCITSFPDAIHTLRFGNPSELHIDSVKAGFLQSYHGLASGEGASYIRSFHLLLLYLLARPVAGTLSPTSVDEASEVLALYFSYFSKKNLLFSGPRHGALRSFAKNLRDLLVHGKLDDQLTASYILGEVKGQYAKFEYQYDNVTVQLPGTTKVLKVTTFLEALESLRSGFAEDLDPASVFSGWYHHNYLRRYTLRQTEIEYAEWDHYDYAVVYLMLKQPAAILQLTTSPDEVKFRARIVHVPVNEHYQGSIMDQSPALLQNARASLPHPTLTGVTHFCHRSYPTPMESGLLRTHMGALKTLRQQIVADSILLPMGVTPVDQRDASVSQLPSSSIHQESREENDSKPSQTVDPVEHSKPAAYNDPRAPLTYDEATVQSLLPKSLERLLASGAYLQKGWLAQVTPTLAPKQQVLLIEKALVKLSQRMKLSKNRPNSSLRRRTFSTLITEAKRMYRMLQARHDALINPNILRRPRNPFTHVVHSTVEADIHETKEWHANEVARYNQLISELQQVEGSDDTTTKQILLRQYHTSQLKVRSAVKYLQRLRIEQKEIMQAKQQLGDATGRPPVAGEKMKTHKDHYQASGVNAQRIVDGFFEGPCLPHRVQHYVLGDLHESFKRAFWILGQRVFPQLIKETGWTDPESLSLAEFETLMYRSLDMRLIHETHRRQFQSLRLIRNAHAHASSEVDVDRLIEFLTDAKDIAYSISKSGLERHVEKYMRLLQSFKQASIRQRDKMQDRFRSIQSSLDYQREMALRKLHRRTRMTIRQSRWTTEEERIDKQYSKAISRSLNELRGIYHERQGILAESLMQFALESQIRNRLRELKPSWASDLVEFLIRDFGVIPDGSSKQTQEGLTQGKPDDHVSDVQFLNPVKLHPGKIAPHTLRLLRRTRKPSLWGDRLRGKQRTFRRSFNPTSDSIQQTNQTPQHLDQFEEDPSFGFLQPLAKNKIHPKTSQKALSSSSARTRPEDQVQKQVKTSHVECKDKTHKEATAIGVNKSNQTTPGYDLSRLVEPIHRSTTRRTSQVEPLKVSHARPITQQNESSKITWRDYQQGQITIRFRNEKPVSSLDKMSMPNDAGDRPSLRFSRSRGVRRHKKGSALSASAPPPRTPENGLTEARTKIDGEETTSMGVHSGTMYTAQNFGNTTHEHEQKPPVHNTPSPPRDTHRDAADKLSKLYALRSAQGHAQYNRGNNASAERKDSGTQYSDPASDTRENQTELR